MLVLTTPNGKGRNLTERTMLYDTYGEEYLNFLRELNEILSVNELVELDYL